MTSIETLTASDRFSLVLGGLCRAVAARIAGGALAPAMIVLIWSRLKRVERQVLRLLTRFRAGRLRVVPDTPVVRSASGGARRGGVASALPRGFAWLIPLVPQWAAGYASQLRVVLAEPEMVALIAAAPQARRALRPLCRMLGIEASVLAPRVAPEPEAVVGPVEVCRLDEFGELPHVSFDAAWRVVLRDPPDG